VKPNAEQQQGPTASNPAGLDTAPGGFSFALEPRNTTWMTMEAFDLLRIVHVAAGVAWLGEVLVVAFVLAPGLERLAGRDRDNLLGHVFPVVFRLATALGGLAILTGFALLWLHSGFSGVMIFGTSWGRALLVALSLALGLYVFHLLMERKLLRLARRMRDGSADPDEAVSLSRHLILIPRAGALVLGSVVALMIYATHYA